MLYFPITTNQSLAESIQSCYSQLTHAIVNLYKSRSQCS